MAAKESQLEFLHELTTKTLIEQFEKYKNSEDGIVPAAFLAQAIKLLKDNNIVADPEVLRKLREATNGVTKVKPSTLDYPFPISDGQH